MKEKLKNKFLGINELSDNRERSFALLLIWLVFIGFVVVYVRENQVERKTDDIKQDIVAFESLDSIFSKYINYKYDISISDLNNNIVYYKGEYNNDINSGTKVNGDETINYKIDNRIVVNVDNGEVVEDLYSNYLAFFFIPNNVYEYVKTLTVNEKEDGDIKKYNYEFVYDDKPIYIDIVTTKDLIDDINVTYDDLKYDIKFSL